MLHIGCHLSSSKGFYHMGKDALAIGANTFQFFTRNPRGSKAKALNLEDIQKLLTLMEENHFGPLLAHAPYTLNPASAKESTREFALQTMEDDLTRLEHLPGSYYNFHPGSHVEQGVEKGTQLIIDTLNTILEKSYTTTILLETMAGKGTEIGRSFEELQGVIEGVHNGASLGVCLDTCHVFDAGYDIVNHLDEVLEKFDHIIGLNKLKAIHINDSKNTLGSHKDRHEKIGDGSIGLPAFIQIINHPKLRRLPFFLETPNELEGYQKEIALLKENYQK